MELIKNFGINPLLLGAQTINFLIILFLLKKFLYKPVQLMLKKRQDIIKEGLDKTEEARLLLEKTKEEEREILKSAQAESAKIIEDAKKESIAMLKTNQEEAKKQADRILKEAKEQIEKETKETEAKLAQKTSSLAIIFLEKVLKDIFSEKEQKEIMNKALGKIERQ